MRNILLISHYTNTPGVMDKIAVYTSSRKFNNYFILHPLFPSSNNKSKLVIGNKIISKFKINYLIQFIAEGIVSAFFIFKYCKNIKFNATICFDPLSFINTYLFKKIMRIDNVVYFNVDYSTKRFNNFIMNYLYLFLDHYSYRKSDYFMYLTEKYISKVDPDNKYTYKAFAIKHIGLAKKNKKVNKIENSIIFTGTLSNTVDFLDLFTALRKIQNDGKNFRFDIYGGGMQKQLLRQKVIDVGLASSINFYAPVSTETLINDVLPKYQIGVAPYIINNRCVKNLDHMFMGTDLTTKIVDYISAGLPVVSTKLYSAFEDIEKGKFGFLVSSVYEWKISIEKLLYSANILNEYSNNAESYSKRYNAEKVLDSVFNKILKIDN